jgi:hypothetical protein
MAIEEQRDEPREPSDQGPVLASLPARRSDDDAEALLLAADAGLSTTSGPETALVPWQEVEVSDITAEGAEWTDFSSDTYSLIVRGAGRAYAASGTGAAGREALEAFRSAALAQGAKRG